MPRIPALCAAILLAVPASSVTAAPPEAGGHAHDATMHHRFDDVDQWVKVFDDPARDEWQKPSEVLRLLDVAPGARVADLGAGTGYFTVRLAGKVGADGKVYAVDIEPTLVDYLKKRAGEAKLPQVVPVLAAPDDPKLPDASVSLVFVCDTWHHIDDRLTYLKRLARALAPGGRLAILDFREGDLPVGPPAGHKLTPDAVKRELETAGWKLVAENHDLPYQYLLTFEPPRPQSKTANP